MTLSAADKKKAATLLCGESFMDAKEYPEKFVVIAKNGMKFNFPIEKVIAILKEGKKKKTRKRTGKTVKTKAQSKPEAKKTTSKRKTTK